MFHLLLSTQSTRYSILLAHSCFFSCKEGWEVDNLNWWKNTVKDENVLWFWVWNELHNGSSVSENPTYWSVWHFLVEVLLEGSYCWHQLRRNIVSSTFWIVYLPTSWSQHHDIKTETKFVLQLKVSIPNLWTFLILDHIANFGSSVDTCLILDKIRDTLSILISANSAY